MDKIVFENIYKKFDDHQVLNGVSFEVRQNEVLTIIGRSGCGKSVMLKHLLGLISPDSGNIYVDGQELSSLNSKELHMVRRKFAMVFQGAALFDSLNVYENVSFGIRRVQPDKEESWIRDKVMEVLSIIGLEDTAHKNPSELSGGMRKRVGVARAVAMDPEILLYDEPTTGLDPVLSRVMDDMIISVSERLKITTIVVTHDMVSVLNVADRVVMLHEGQIIDGGTPAELRHTNNPILADFFRSSVLPDNVG